MIMENLRVDVTKRPVGSFFGGRSAAAVSCTCPVCGKPGLIVKTINRGTRTTRHIAHGFKLVLNEKFEPECQWDEPCVETAP